jgi:hypothetical protein
MNVMGILALLLFWSHTVTAQAPVGTLAPLARIRAIIKVNPITQATPQQLAGIYKEPPKEWIKEWGGTLEGDWLFIFPDNTYIHCEYSDLQPFVIDDKGTWAFSDGTLTLHSSPDVIWHPLLDRNFLAVQRPSHKREILLLRLEADLSFFFDKAKDDPETTLLAAAKIREESLRGKTITRWKDYLLREKWKPEEFQEGAPSTASESKILDCP